MEAFPTEHRSKWLPRGSKTTPGGAKIDQNGIQLSKIIPRTIFSAQKCIYSMSLTPFWRFRSAFGLHSGSNFQQKIDENLVVLSLSNFIDFLKRFASIFDCFLSSKITLIALSTRLLRIRKNLKKHHRVASKWGFAGPEVYEKSSSKGKFGHEKNQAQRRSQKKNDFGQISGRFWSYFGSPNG